MNMKKTGHSLTASSMIALAVATAGAALPTVAAAQEDTAAEERVGTVITVTARKREENLLEVPLAITAVAAQEIEERGITSVTDLIDNTPGINVTSTNSGRNDRSFQQISLRGFTPSTTTSTLTASFINGVPVSSATALNAVIDPERIEVLRGPQPAYFGRNAFAGAINIVTRTPSDSFGGSVDAQWSERNGYDISASLEGPLVENLVAFRITGRTWGTDGGYTNSWNPNQTLGNQSTRVITGQLEFTPTPDLTLRVFGMYSEDEDGPSPEGLVSLFELRAVPNATTGVAAPNLPFISGNSNGNLVLPSSANCTLTALVNGGNPAAGNRSRPYICGALPTLSIAPGSNTPEDSLLSGHINPANDPFRVVPYAEGAKGYGLVREYRHVHATLDYDIGETGFSVSGLFGYNLEFYSEIDDLDQYDSSAFVNNTARGYWNFPFMVERENEDLSAELRLSYDSGPLQAMAGVSYLDTKAVGDLISIFNVEQLGAPLNGSALGAPAHVKTTGLFGSFSYDITDQLNLSAEGRFQRDKVYANATGTRNFVGVTFAANNPLGVTPGTYAFGETYLTKNYNNFTPRVTLSYDITPDVMAYASFSQAVNVSSASFNSAFVGRPQAEVDAATSLGLELVLKPEKLDNYEIGLKGSFLDGRVRASLSAYHAIWTDQYNNRSLIFQSGNNVLLVSGVANSGKTVLDGIELDLAAEPVDGLTLTFSGSMNDSSIRTFSNPAISLATGLLGNDFEGNQNPLSSKWSANGGIMYRGYIPSWDDGEFFVRGDFGYKSRQFINQSNLTWIKGRATVDLRAGVSREGYSLQVFVNNLFDDQNYVSASESALLDPFFTMSGYGGTGQFFVALPERRTFGIRAGYEF